MAAFSPHSKDTEAAMRRAEIKKVVQFILLLALSSHSPVVN
jgi:hypothetical protein